MIRDLEKSGTVTETADIVVIGAGTVGLVVSVLLARKGYSVVCLESGGWRQESDEHPLNEIVQVRSRYAGAAEGRFRCLGGTSTRWGGALIPFQAADMDPALWPVSLEELTPYINDVETLFGLESGPYEFTGLLDNRQGGYILRLAKWPPFKRRNVFNLFDTTLNHDTGPRIWLNATVCEFTVGANALQSVIARSQDGGKLTAHARTFIIAAGAIETTRLTLLLDRQNDSVLTTGSPALGKYFHDHLSMPVADLKVNKHRACNRTFGFHFGHGGTMRNLRFELAENSPLRKHLPACFAHVAFEGGNGAYNALRDTYCGLQQGRAPSLSTLLQLLAGFPWLLRALWWRLVEKRLLFPTGSSLQAHLIIEQIPLAENCIRLSDSKQDPFGQPLAEIDWGISEADRKNMSAATAAFLAMWEQFPLQHLATLEKRPERAMDEALVTSGGIFHPGGSTRMARTAKDGVVDSELRLFGLPNVRLLSTSVFPTGGGANPTMMLLMFGLRCVDQLENEMKSESLLSDH